MTVEGVKSLYYRPSGSVNPLFCAVLTGEEYDEGSIVVDGIPLDTNQNINAVRREVGVVSQSFNLFAHLTVMENLMLAQTIVHKGPKKSAVGCQGASGKVGIPEKAESYPSQLQEGSSNGLLCPRWQ